MIVLYRRMISYFIIILISVVCHIVMFLHKHFPFEMIIKVIKVFVMLRKEVFPSPDFVLR